METLTCQKCGTVLPSTVKFCFDCGTPLSAGRVRIPIPSKLRFEVFKRDSFSCRYCGARAPQAGGTATLHVDHVLPVAEGGTNDPSNLVAACSDCNRGKGAELLSEDTYIQIANMQEALAQRLQALDSVMELIYSAVLQATKAYWAIGAIPPERHPMVEFHHRQAIGDRIGPHEENDAMRETRWMIEDLEPKLKFEQRSVAIAGAIAEVKSERRRIQYVFVNGESEGERDKAASLLKYVDRTLTDMENLLRNVYVEEKAYKELPLMVRMGGHVARRFKRRA